MKLIITICICKLVRLIGRALGRGSSLPGKVALRLYPDVLTVLKLPDIVIAVTGSNGKTSTSEMIAHILTLSGMNVGHNREGSNQTDGIATLLLGAADIKGNIKRDALVLECDERWAVKIFKHIKPSALLITNLCRDQLTRNGHHEFIAGCLSEAIKAAGEQATLVLNADDPFVQSLAATNNPTLYFSVGKDAAPAHQRKGVYDDGAYCPCCKAKMDYRYRIAAHFGSFRCKACGFAHQTPDVRVSSFDYELGEAIINDSISIWVTGKSLNNLYNTAAAIAGAKAAGLKEDAAARKLDKYEIKNARSVSFKMNRRNVKLLICKHENSLAYNQSLTWIIKQHRPCTVIIAVDSISRKYYTSETSWLWDIDIDILADEGVREVVLTGRYVNELMLRFAMSGVDIGKCCDIKDMRALREKIEGSKTDDLYILTCFADKAKLMKSLRINL